MSNNQEHQYVTIGVPSTQDAVDTTFTSELTSVLSDVNAIYSSNHEHSNTWSYYNSEDTFIRFLGLTSYYLGLQRNLCKIISILKPVKIFEFGFGTGHTSVRIAKENPSSIVTAIDFRENMIEIGTRLAKRIGVSNVFFAKDDMLERVKHDLSDFDFVFLLYNFHHIEDADNSTSENKKNSKKIEFLRNCYNNMKDGAYLCIADVFITNDETETRRLFEQRVAEGSASTFWGGLSSLDAESISEARRAADFCKRNEEQVGIKVLQRKYEYPITLKWLRNSALNTGFNEILSEEVNFVGDAIMLFRKTN